MLLNDWRTFRVRQVTPFFICVCVAFLTSAPLSAQETETTYLDMPESEQADAYRDAAGRTRIQMDIQYVDETNADFLVDGARPTEARPARDGEIYLPTGGGGPGVFIVVALFVIALILFLKFGAGGTLLQGDPKNVPTKKKSTEGWGLKLDDIPEGDLLSRIRAMPDRREALILLLRYCLLRAADVTETNFRRADTEREALGRLPEKWPLFGNLRRLLMQTELVHYGGRDIDDAAYDTALNDGAEILNVGGRNGQ